MITELKELLANEMDFALDHAQKLASLRQSDLVSRICDIFAEENGQEASAADLCDIFEAIKQDFADEAAEEAENAEEDSESESVSASVSASEAESAGVRRGDGHRARARPHSGRSAPARVCGHDLRRTRTAFQEREALRHAS